MKQKRSKAIDVQFYWLLRDRARQGQFQIYWDAGKDNLADYFTKHHPPSHHEKMGKIHTYIEGVSPGSLQGCIRMMNEEQPRRLTLTLNIQYPQQMTNAFPWQQSRLNKRLITILNSIHN